MKTYILETESGFFLSKNNEGNHTKSVSDIKEATKFNYNETKQYRLFGSLSILCRSIGFDKYKLISL